jgi:hypothetical protein
MEFVPAVSDPAHPRLAVPWFSRGAKAYEAAGLESWLFYPHNEGFDVQHIIEGNFHGKTWQETAGFLQRWAYCGMIEEILEIGGLLGGPLATASSMETLRSSSEFLPYMVLLWNCVRPSAGESETDEIEARKFLHISVILKRVNLFYNLLCEREYSRRPSRKVFSGHPPQLAWAPHSHEHEETLSDWDEWADELLGAKLSFFTKEPLGPGGFSPLDSPGHALLLSIGTAGELMTKAVEQKYGRKIKNLKWAIPLTIVRRLELAGWCPVWLRKLRDEGSVIRAYYLSSIRRTPLRKHARWGVFGCIASQVNVTTYQARHTTEACDCGSVEFSLGDHSDYASWIKAGHTPLIVRTLDPVSGATKWTLIRSHNPVTGDAIKYVAISHVWIDGTGSAGGNSLLRCQLNKFQNAAIRLYDGALDTDTPTPFWVDTICVPYDQGLLKSLALRQMEHVYRDADSVLVFDSSLQQVPLGLSTSECLTRIEISSWNERLWTIQEAVFAKELYFQFQDGTISLQQLIFRYRLERFARLANLYRTLKSDVSPSRITAMFCKVIEMHLHCVTREGEDLFERPPGIDGGDWVGLAGEGLSSPPDETEMEGLALDTIFLGTLVAVSGFLNILKEKENPTSGESAREKWSKLESVLPYRQTSIASDEGLCLATLLGMDLTNLYGLPDEERVRRMFLHIGVVGESVLFGARRRLARAGYRWMPSTFVNQPVQQSERTALVTEVGIEVTLPALKVLFPSVGRGFIHNVRPGGIPGDFGFLRLDDDDEDGPGWLLCGAFPVRLIGTQRLFTVHLVLPAEGAGMIVPLFCTMTLVLEKELVRHDQTVATGQTTSFIHAALRGWAEMQEGPPAVHAIVLDPAAKGAPGTMSYKLPAVVVEFEEPTLEQLAAAAQARVLPRTKWIIS